jgi:6-phosphogluconolactonase
MRIRSWVLALLAGAALALFNSCSNNNSSTTLGTGFMWVATTGDRTLSSLTIDLSNGSVSSVKSTAQSGPNPSAMGLTSDGSALFVSNIDDNCGSAQTPAYCDTVRPFSINSDGTIGNQGTTVQITSLISNAPLGLKLGFAIDPTGKFLFVSDQGNSGPIGSAGTVEGTISVFSISGTTLTPVGSPIVTTQPGDTIGTGPAALAIPSSGGYLYAANEFTSTVSAYSYDSNGNLSFMTNYPVAANPTALAFSRTVAASNRDNFLFVSNTGSNQVSVLSACVATSLSCATANGLLTPVTGSPFSAPTGPGQIIVNPAFDWVYVIEHSNQVSQFSFAPATGALSPLSPAAVSTGAGPVSGGITSDGNWVFVANGLGSNLSALGVGAAGKLSPAATATVLFANQPSAVLVR